MAREEIKHETKNFTYREYVDFVKNIDQSKRIYGSDTSVEEGNSEWLGTDSMEEAFDYAINGWEAGIEELDIEDGIEVNGHSSFTPDVQGALVNLNSYLVGAPDSMYAITEEREFLLDELTIFVPLNYTASFSAANGLKYCKSVIKMINEYQKNHNVRIIGLIDSIQNRSTHHRRSVQIKQFDTRFVINNIAFCFHPSFYRRLNFHDRETCSYLDSGYGSTASQEFFNRYAQEILEEERSLKEKYIVAPRLNNTDGGEFHDEDVLKFNFKKND